MLEFKASAFLATSTMLRTLRNTAERQDIADGPISDHVRALLTRELKSLLGHIEPLHLPMAEMSIRSLMGCIADYDWFTFKNFADDYGLVEGRLRDELEVAGCSMHRR